MLGRGWGGANCMENFLFFFVTIMIFLIRNVVIVVLFWDEEEASGPWIKKESKNKYEWTIFTFDLFFDLLLLLFFSSH